MQLKKEMLTSPAAISIIYFVITCMLVLIFRGIFPGEAAPLPIYSQDWRLIRGIIEVFNLFPALFLSALVIPYCLTSEGNYASNHAAHLFQHLMASVITAISAAVLYALLFFLILPIVENNEKNMRYEGEIYRMAKERMRAHSKAGEWIEASHYVGICDSIWKDSPDWKENPPGQGINEFAELRKELDIFLGQMHFQRENSPQVGSRFDRGQSGTGFLAFPGREPVDATEALSMAETAFEEGRLFDSHWLATLAGRIAEDRSPEKAIAARIAAKAWNEIEKQQETLGETHIFAMYRLKQSGYHAMVSGDWIRAYYIFLELVSLTPHDPDVHHFLAVCEEGTKNAAFFIDELEFALGETYAGAIYSLPYTYGQDNEQGRIVMRAASLSATPDYAYGVGIEYMVFDSQAHPLLSLQASYAKFLPITLDDQQRVLVMMRALDRYDSKGHREPQLIQENDTLYHPGTAQFTLNISYDAFLKLPQMRQGLSGMYISELYDAAEKGSETGYIPQVFEAEILNRLGTCLFLLPISVIVIAIGWRYRATKRTLAAFVLMLPILPLIFILVTYVYKIVLNTVGISLISAFGFSTALALLITIISVSFVLSLILLAVQRE